MEAFLPFLLKLVGWAVGVFGGAVAIENMLENYIMVHVPQWAKGLVVPIISLLFGVWQSMQGGLSLPQAFTAALGLAASTIMVHNHPDLTSATLPDPPATADGLPALK